MTKFHTILRTIVHFMKQFTHGSAAASLTHLPVYKFTSKSSRCICVTFQKTPRSEHSRRENVVTLILLRRPTLLRARGARFASRWGAVAMTECDLSAEARAKAVWGCRSAWWSTIHRSYPLNTGAVVNEVVSCRCKSWLASYVLNGLQPDSTLSSVTVAESGAIGPVRKVRISGLFLMQAQYIDNSVIVTSNKPM